MPSIHIEVQQAEEECQSPTSAQLSSGHTDLNVTIALAEKRDISTALRVLVVDDHQMVREGLCCMLKDYDSLTVVGEASTGEQALQLVGTLVPNVVIMDMNMPGWDGAETTKRILKAHPSTTVIGLSVQTDPHVAQSMLDAGAAAFVQKDTVGQELYVTIQTAVHRRASSPSTTSPPCV
jgi:DNA-binding NarL/FixJ family response regulator